MLNSDNPFIRQFLAGESPGPALDGLVAEPTVGPARPRLTLAVVALLALVWRWLAHRAHALDGVNTFVSSSSPDYAATQAMYRQFGSDPVVVLVRAAADQADPASAT